MRRVAKSYISANSLICGLSKEVGFAYLDPIYDSMMLWQKYMKKKNSDRIYIVRKERNILIKY